MKMKRLLPVALCICMIMTFTVQAVDATVAEKDAAAAYLKEQGIMVGDQSGNMNLDKGITRAELAAVLTRLNGNPEHVQAEQDFYSSQCTFSDVPAWAKTYVGYCYSNGLMIGYDTGAFGSYDGVTPAAACTVVLRYMEVPEKEWNYSTACQSALERELITVEAAVKPEITRGDLAIMLYRASESPAIFNGDIMGEPVGAGVSKNPDGSINLPADGSQYVPKVGDVIRCDDGSNYTITDVSRWDKSMFAAGPIGALPKPTCDWSLLEQPELPPMEVRHFKGETGDNLRVRNLYETRRMQYTLYNAIGSNPETWENGAPKLTSKGNQLVHIKLSISDDQSYQMFWPWRESEIVTLFNSLPPGTYSMQAWDVYKDGKFLHTEYQIRVE